MLGNQIGNPFRNHFTQIQHDKTKTTRQNKCILAPKLQHGNKNTTGRCKYNMTTQIKKFNKNTNWFTQIQHGNTNTIVVKKYQKVPQCPLKRPPPNYHPKQPHNKKYPPKLPPK